MPNFDGIWELRGYYSTVPAGFTSMEHRFTMDIDLDGTPTPGTPFSDIACLGRDGTPIILDDWADDLTAAWIDCYPATASLGRFELWKFDEGSLNGLYISTYEVGENGTNVAGSYAASQATWTFRSLNGGVARFQLMESSFGGDAKSSPPYGTIDGAVATLLTAETSPMLARDNSYVFANIHFSQGQNEKLWRKRYRS